MKAGDEDGMRGITRETRHQPWRAMPSQPSAALSRFREVPPGYRGGMELSLLLIVIGIILALLVNYAVGFACILIGLVLLIWPRLRTGP
jgi:hypothetical protein